MFDGVDGKYACEHDFEEHELAKLRISTEISRLGGLKVFKLSPGHCSFTNTDKKRETYRCNVTALESVIKKGIEATRQEVAESHANSQESSGPSATVPCVPLYHRCKVCFDCSSVHDSGDDRIDGMIRQLGFKRLQQLRERRSRHIRTASIPNSKKQIKNLLRTHADQIIEYLYETKQKYNADIAAKLYGQD